MGQKIVMDFGKVQVPATLNDTETARAFADALPLKVNVSGTGIDFCGVMPKQFPYTQDQVKRGWKNGDVNYNPGGGWFALLYDDEQNSQRYGDQVNLGHVDGPLDVLHSLAGSYTVEIRKAE